MDAEKLPKRKRASKSAGEIESLRERCSELEERLASMDRQIRRVLNRLEGRTGRGLLDLYTTVK